MTLPSTGRAPAPAPAGGGARSSTDLPQEDRDVVEGHRLRRARLAAAFVAGRSRTPRAPGVRELAAGLLVAALAAGGTAAAAVVHGTSGQRPAPVAQTETSARPGAAPVGAAATGGAAPGDDGPTDSPTFGGGAVYGDAPADTDQANLSQTRP